MSMTRAEAARLLESARDPRLRKVLSGASGGALRANAGDLGVSEPKTLRIVILSQLRGGKNAVQTTRTGHRYPNKAWAAWRDMAVAQVVSQLPTGWQPIDRHVTMTVNYYAGDLKRRDQPALWDAIGHVFERANVTRDDFFLWIKGATKALDRENPRTEITIHLT